MTLKSLFLRFFLGYFALLIISGIIVSYIGLTTTSSVNVSVLFCMVLWVCMDFGKKNGRYFTQSEKSQVFIGLNAINVTVQLLLGLPVFFSMGPPQSIGIVSAAVVFVLFIHAIVIYAFVNLAKKTLIKQNLIPNDVA